MLIKVVIPIYKESLSEDEKESLNQAIVLLKNYPFVFVTHKELETSAYITVLEEKNANYSFEYFDAGCFENIYSYNTLLLSRLFYERFNDVPYMLIYQLDGFVFKDDLKDWCKKGYDYIGAPWFTKYGTFESGEKLYMVGNGGVSLRKTTTFIKTFDQKPPFKVLSFYIKNIRKKAFLRMTFNTMKMAFFLLFTQRKMEYYLLHLTDPRINEDCFWADGLSNTSLRLKVPHILTAATFCFEKSPSYLYRLTDNKLPSFCHAYKKYEYETFWKERIEPLIKNDRQTTAH